MINLTTTQKLMLREVRSFMEKEVAPYSREMDTKMEFRPGLKEKLGEMGYFSLLIPTEYGGAGLNLTDFCLVLEEISKIDGAVGVTVQACCTSLRPILLAGSSELKERIFSQVTSQGLLSGFAMTEPESGSDVASIKSTAVRRGDKYILNGTKTLITNAGIADLYTVMAVTQPGGGHRGISVVVVPAGTKGLSFGKKEDKNGYQGFGNGGGHTGGC